MRRWKEPIRPRTWRLLIRLQPSLPSNSSSLTRQLHIWSSKTTTISMRIKLSDMLNKRWKSAILLKSSNLSQTNCQLWKRPSVWLIKKKSKMKSRCCSTWLRSKMKRSLNLRVKLACLKSTMKQAIQDVTVLLLWDIIGHHLGTEIRSQPNQTDLRISFSRWTSRLLRIRSKLWLRTTMIWKCKLLLILNKLRTFQERLTR